VSSPFEIATALRQENDNQFHGEIPDGWQQGKGAFGGVVIGLLTRALVTTEKDPSRHLRTLSADLCAPAMPGPVQIEVEPLRQGGSMSFIEARLRQKGAVVARASAVIAAARNIQQSNIHPSPPVRPPFNDAPILPMGPPAPVFMQHYELRNAGPLPFAGGKEAVAAGWVWERVRATRIDEAAIVALLDSWWPTSFAIEDLPRAHATVGYTMQLLTDPKTVPLDEPVFYRAKGVAARDNFYVEMREIWHGDRIIAMNQQTFAALT